MSTRSISAYPNTGEWRTKACSFRKGLICAIYATVLSLAVSLCQAQDLNVVTGKSELTIYPGQQNIPLVVTVTGGTFDGPITVTLTGLPSGVTVSPLTLTSGSSGTLYVSASRSAGAEGFDPTVLSGAPTSWTASVALVAAAGSTQATTPLPLTISISNSSFALSASAINLPIIRINTNGSPIVSKDIDVPGTLTITSADGQTAYLPSAGSSDNSATFHLHGNSTLYMPKLSYKVKLNTSVDLLAAMGLICPYVTKGKAACDKSKSYILLANYDDKTLLRDWAAYALANAIPMGNGYLGSPAESPSPSGTTSRLPWAAHSLFVELYLNGAYQGNYQLVEQIKVDSHRVNITALSETDTSQSQITGGYLMEIDRRMDQAYTFQTPQGISIGLVDPDFSPHPNVPEQTAYISGYLATAENALFSNNFTDPAAGWRAYFDEAALVNFYIVNDLMGNVDGGLFLGSDYLYKDRNNPLIYMGPVWDFDISSGNVNYSPILNPLLSWMPSYPSWYVQLFKDPGFRADVAQQWNSLKTNGVFNTWLGSIQQQAKNLDQSQANNFQRWPMQAIAVWPNAQAAGSYADEIAYFTNWLNLRFGFLDSGLNQKAPTSTSLDSVDAPVEIGSPVTLTAEVSLGSGPAGVVTFLSDGIIVGAGPLSAGGVARLTISTLPAGTHWLQAIYNSDNQNSFSLSPVQGITILPRKAVTVTSVAGSFLNDASASLTVSVIAQSGTAVPTGTVTLTLDSDTTVTVPLDVHGQGKYTTSDLQQGAHTVTAVYAGDINDSTSTSAPFVVPQHSDAVPEPAIGGVVKVAIGAASQEISPGSFIAIYGTELAGNGNPVASWPWPTTLNGTQVLLGGIPMQLLYASPDQVNAQVPQDLAPGSSYALVVVHGTAASNAASVPVQQQLRD